MNRARWLPLLVGLAALAAAGGAFFSTRHLATRATPPPADELAWLQQEFQLTPAQAAEIERLHDDYAPVCAGHCAAISATRETLAAASDDAARTAARAELDRLRRVCTTATHAHLRAVAAAMDPAQGRRFLALVEPRLASHDHQAPLALP